MDLVEIVSRKSSLGFRRPQGRETIVRNPLEIRKRREDFFEAGSSIVRSADKACSISGH